MNKQFVTGILLLVLFSMQDLQVYAQEFSGQEEYYEDYCSYPRRSSEEAQV